MTDNSDNEQIRQRRGKLAVIRNAGEAYPNDFRRTHMSAALHHSHDDTDGEELEALNIRVAVAGRLMAKRVMGKASFAHLQDRSGRIQLFVQRDALPEGVYNEQFKKLDVGDVVGATGTLFRTRTGELSVRTDSVRLLAKSLRPLPEKYHGLVDTELRYRQRYVDLIVTAESRQVFRTRAAAIDAMRRFMVDHEFLEVETPMMHPIPGGALARPFVTHHNALDMPLYLRIAPELYLKRLIVGGFEKVFEVNRNFRNEGMSTQHNPEFTMLEYYEAYADYEDMMALTERMLRTVVAAVTGGGKVDYQGTSIDFGAPFRRVSVADAVLARNPDLDADDLIDRSALRKRAQALGIEVLEAHGPGKILVEIFEKTVERTLEQPTFVTQYPIEVSPLSRRSEQRPDLADRFELFITGREIANGFSELNDPEDQAERFREQASGFESGDEEAMHYDTDYVRALEYGMPPAGGVGVGVDRLVMLLTDSASIRDVLLFPHMRPE